jgi:thiol-disulfide isomerase/thioredoxin
MKKFICVFFSFVLLTVTHAQEYDPVPPYQKDSTIPAFSILQTDSVSWFNKAGLPANKPVVIVYFNPECGHCQLTAHDFEEKKNQLKDVFFVWVTYDTSFTKIRSFAEQYNLLGAKNIRIGRDPKYYVPSFFRVKYTPFMAVYNKDGRLLQTYESGTDPETIIRLLKL